ncbi:cell division protein DivIB [Clostridium homopropionicum DSM 5847]|uniref:Cell division protein DivIB n=1 Tax=Clostridium homopropionicum DSM 5847 TaxID=1121318 RepID=A0A0L6ZDE7_9CLOT|nr:FtsQ-type POTRA domain-containing protein [Clostridium homopropionicum]KOA20977.1 cell division protein DivIB [Clostridium homopropionicum DSM 5847]SFG00531.1 cell division protein FtsQ [Clostridium homopropionicum]
MSKDLTSNTNNRNISKNYLIEKRRRKRKIKRYFFLLIILISVSITLCLKLNYFNINNIDVIDNRNIPSEEIIKLSAITKGNNIFYTNLKKSKANILSNSYILNVNIKRKLPNTIQIFIQERSAIFYIKKGDIYLIVDREGVILEEKQKIDSMKLIKLEGFDKDNYKLGEAIETKDERKLKLIGEITTMIENLQDGVPEPSIVNIEDLTDIKFFYGDMMIKFGTSEDFTTKYNRALNILIQNKLIKKSGYIDVSFKGDPVFFLKD